MTDKQRLDELGKHLADQLAKQAQPRPEMIEAILGMTGGAMVALGAAYGVPQSSVASLANYLFER